MSSKLFPHAVTCSLCLHGSLSDLCLGNLEGALICKTVVSAGGEKELDSS